MTNITKNFTNYNILFFTINNLLTFKIIKKKKKNCVHNNNNNENFIIIIIIIIIIIQMWHLPSLK